MAHYIFTRSIRRSACRDYGNFYYSSMTSVLYFYSYSTYLCSLLLFVKGGVNFYKNTCATSILSSYNELLSTFFIVCFFFHSFFVISVIYERNLKPLQLLCLLSIELTFWLDSNSLLLFSSTAEFRHQQFIRQNLSQDYDMVNTPQDNSELVWFVREVLMKKYPMPNLPKL